MQPITTVGIADRSSHVRQGLRRMIAAEPDLDVIGTYADADALMKAPKEHLPDVLIADVDLPQLTHLLELRHVSRKKKMRVILSISAEQLSQNLVDEARRSGISDLWMIPEHTLRPRLQDGRANLLRKIRSAAKGVTSQMRPDYSLGFPCACKDSTLNSSIIVIGASTGGTEAMELLLKRLPPEVETPILIAQHIPPEFTYALVGRLQRFTKRGVVAGTAGMTPRPNMVIVAPGGKNMLLKTRLVNGENQTILALRRASLHELNTPSVDMLLHSAAEIYGQATYGLILSGMGKDGTEGAQAVASKGGVLLAQDGGSAAVFGMPESVIKQGVATHVMPVHRMASFLAKNLTK